MGSRVVTTERFHFVVSDGTLIKFILSFEPNQIKSVDNRGTFDLNDNNIYHQASVYYPNKVIIDEGIVDLTYAFDSIPTQKEVEEFVNDAIKSGKKFITLSPDFFFDAPTRKKAIRKFINDGNYKKLDKKSKSRYRKYIIALEKIADNSIQLPPPEGVLNKKDAGKPMVEKYYYFGARVKFGDKVFNIVFDVEKNKNESENKPQTVHLYNITEKGNFVGHGANTHDSNKTKLPNTNTISQSEINVNNQSKDIFEQRAFVSMKSELVGDYLDADEFEGTGGNASAHGWGNYLLKDRKTNKVIYFNRWNR